MTVSPARGRCCVRPCGAIGEFDTPWLRCGVVSRPFRGLALAVVVAAAVAAGCSIGGDGPRDDLAADTARFTYGDRTVVVALTACGRDGDVVVLAGTSGGTVLQAEADLGD